MNASWKPDGPLLYDPNKPIGPGNRVNGSHLPKPYGEETYFIQGGEICRKFARHPGIQVHRNCLWTWI